MFLLGRMLLLDHSNQFLKLNLITPPPPLIKKLNVEIVSGAALKLHYCEITVSSLCYGRILLLLQQLEDIIKSPEKVFQS